MEMKRIFCLGFIILGTNGFSKLRTALDVQKEYLECTKSKECREKHTPKIRTSLTVMREYIAVTDKNLERIRQDNKRKEEEKKRKKLEEEKRRREFNEKLKKEEEKRRREHKEFIEGIKRWYGKLKF